jgi:hypothetical protein
MPNHVNEAPKTKKEDSFHLKYLEHCTATIEPAEFQVHSLKKKSE